MSDNLMTCELVDEILPGFLEGDLSAARTEALNAHVSECARCTSLLRDIDAVRESAAALPGLEPGVDLWKGIAARIETPVVVLGERQPRRFATPVWLAVAASLLVVASSGITYVLTARKQASPSPVTQQASVTVPSAANAKGSEVARTAVAVADEPTKSSPVLRTGSEIRGRSAGGAARLVSNRRMVTVFAPDTVFASEIARLQRVINEKRATLDPQTVAIVEKNLELIDAAIQSSRSALRGDPASGFLNQQLSRALDKKAELLRTVAEMPSST